jgi:hypothetical protein
MITVQHTDWPWYASGLRTAGQRPGVDISGAHGCCIALAHKTHDITEAETIANAKLIASAPDLHDTLRRLVEALQVDHMDEQMSPRVSVDLLRSAQALLGLVP